MKLNIAICDDEPKELENIASIVKDWGKYSGHVCELKTFSSAETFLFAYEEDKTYDILLLDVEMGEMSGIALAKKLRKEENQAEIIFITSHFEFCGEGYEVDALHYLIKPISEQKLHMVLNKAVEKLQIEPPSVVIICEGETVKLYENEIFYVESLLHYISIHTKDKEYKIKENLSTFAKKLSDDFYQTHRSYLVSLKKIVKISRSAVCLKDKTEIPLSRGKYDDINRAFIEHN